MRRLLRKSRLREKKFTGKVREVGVCELWLSCARIAFILEAKKIEGKIEGENTRKVRDVGVCEYEVLCARLWR